MGYPVVPKRFTRNDFEKELTKHKKNIEEIDGLIRNGLVKSDDYLYTLDDVVKICTSVAGGFWDNGSLQPTQNNAWARAMRSKQIKEIIKQAFT
jgi:hypothetical protein